MNYVIIKGKLAKDFTNRIEKETFTIKNRTQIKEGVFVSIKNPEIDRDQVDTSGMSEGFIPKWAKEDVEYYNGKTSYPLKVRDESGKVIDIDTLGGAIPYGSEVHLALKLASSGYYYPSEIKIINFNDDVVDDNPFA